MAANNLSGALCDFLSPIFESQNISLAKIISFKSLGLNQFHSELVILKATSFFLFKYVCQHFPVPV